MGGAQIRHWPTTRQELNLSSSLGSAYTQQAFCLIDLRTLYIDPWSSKIPRRSGLSDNISGSKTCLHIYPSAVGGHSNATVTRMVPSQDASSSGWTISSTLIPHRRRHSYEPITEPVPILGIFLHISLAYLADGFPRAACCMYSGRLQKALLTCCVPGSSWFRAETSVALVHSAQDRANGQRLLPTYAVLPRPRWPLDQRELTHVLHGVDTRLGKDGYSPLG